MQDVDRTIADRQADLADPGRDQSLANQTRGGRGRAARQPHQHVAVDELPRNDFGQHEVQTRERRRLVGARRELDLGIPATPTRVVHGHARAQLGIEQHLRRARSRAARARVHRYARGPARYQRLAESLQRRLVGQRSREVHVDLPARGALGDRSDFAGEQHRDVTRIDASARPTRTPSRSPFSSTSTFKRGGVASCTTSSPKPRCTTAVAAHRSCREVGDDLFDRARDQCLAGELDEHLLPSRAAGDRGDPRAQCTLDRGTDLGFGKSRRHFPRGDESQRRSAAAPRP